MQDQPTEASQPASGQSPTAGQPAAVSQPPAPSQPAASSPPAAGSLITFDDFTKVQLRVGKVLEAMDHPKADKLLVLKVDLGTEQRQIVAGIRGYCQPQDLLGRNIVIVANLQPRMMRGYESQGMLLAASSDSRDKVIVVTVEGDIPAGSKVS
jgi:methionyl-tRNA synthetase